MNRIDHVIAVTAMVACLSATPNVAIAKGSVARVVVVEPARKVWLTHHAATELARYVRQMTGAPVGVTTKRPRSSTGVTILTLSVGLGAEPLRKLPGAVDPERLRDGFVIASTAPRELRIAATQPVGLLYGVYDYLERFCKVGFFWDGDNVPRRADLPVAGIRAVELPRFALRHFGLSDGWGLAKFHHHFRTTADRHRILDWMAKRKINITHLGFAPTIAGSGIPREARLRNQRQGTGSLHVLRLAGTTRLPR